MNSFYSPYGPGYRPKKGFEINAYGDMGIGSDNFNSYWEPAPKPKPKPAPKAEPKAAPVQGHSPVFHSSLLPELPQFPDAPISPAVTNPLTIPVPDDAARRAALERKRAKNLAGGRKSSILTGGTNNLNLLWESHNQAWNQTTSRVKMRLFQLSLMVCATN